MVLAVTLHPEIILQHAGNIEQCRSWAALEMLVYFPALSVLDAMHWTKSGTCVFLWLHEL